MVTTLSYYQECIHTPRLGSGGGVKRPSGAQAPPNDPNRTLAKYICSTFEMIIKVIWDVI